MSRFEEKGNPAVYAAICALIAAVFLADWKSPLGIAIWIFFLVPLALSLRLNRPNLPIGVAIVCTVAMAVGYPLSSAGVASRLAQINRDFGFVVIWGFAVMARQMIVSRLITDRQRWLRMGQNGLSESMQGDLRSEQLGERILQFLAPYLDAQAGLIYILEKERLRPIAGFAHEVSPNRQFALGEGLPGQAALQKKTFHIQDLPDDYLKVESGLGAANSRELLVTPAVINDAVQGVVELGFLHPIDPSDVEMLDHVADRIGIALRSSLDRMQLEHLLEQTQRQAQELQSQQEELRVANEELEEQSTMLRESQSRLELQQAELEQTNSHLEEQTERLTRQNDELESVREMLTGKGAELERASRYKSEFLANMSHELRTPLNSSLILAKLLSDNKDGNLTHEQVEFAETIYSAGNDLLDLINDILDLSKIESGKIDLRPEHVDLARLVDSLTRTFQPLAEQKRIRFLVTVDALAPGSIETDSQRLQQILKNLLSNALKFTEQGEVALQISGGSDESVRFTVRDTGIGIPESQHSVIFEAFRQADGTINRKHGGTGLGLSISRDLARLLGGEIELRSAPGKGSAFSLLLPTVYKPGERPPSVHAARPAPAPRPAAATPAALLRKKEALAASIDDRQSIIQGSRILLVVEDDPAFAKILYDLAHELGFDCLIAPSAGEGIELALQFRPAALVLDIHLPDHSGLTVLDRLKRNPATRHIPVQIVSVEDYTQTALEMGAAGYMLKPVKREQLAEALSKLEAKFSQSIHSVLVVEDDRVQRESICRLLEAQDVRTIPVETAAAALEQLRASTHDCMVLDISLPDASGFELLETMAQEEQYSFPPVIIYTGRSLSDDEEQLLRKYSKSIIIKGAHSPERLLDEVTLFLHQVEANLPADRRRMLQEARSREAIFEARTVLIVEDDVRNIFALSSILEPKGATLKIARNGKEALAALTANSDVDLVLMDIMMPEMDGYEAMQQIRRRPELQRLPIIALTAKAMRDDQERCLAAGANDYIAKPIEVEQLLSLMRVWMPRE